MQKIILNIIAIVLLTIILNSCAEEPTTTTSATVISVITSYTPQKGYFGDTVKIKGTNFADSSSSSYVIFDSLYAGNVVRWNDTAITVVIPEGPDFGLGYIRLINTDTTSAKYPFTFLQPTLPDVEKDMVLIPAGTFRMGDISGTGNSNELPVRNVTISKAFYISKYEVTQNQWKALMTTNPSVYKDSVLTMPVSGISWIEAVYFCNYLSARYSLTPCYKIDGINTTCDFNASGYRLPTEAEWEYAARDGSKSDYFNGNDSTELTNYAWYYSNIDSLEHPKAIGGKSPNAWGLYDILGNVAEFCWDWSSDSYNPADTLDPKGPSSGPGRVLRGGCWVSSALGCRIPFRSYLEGTNYRDFYCGFRIVRTKQ